MLEWAVSSLRLLITQQSRQNHCPAKARHVHCHAFVKAAAAKFCRVTPAGVARMLGWLASAALTLVLLRTLPCHQPATCFFTHTHTQHTQVHTNSHEVYRHPLYNGLGVLLSWPWGSIGAMGANAAKADTSSFLAGSTCAPSAPLPSRTAAATAALMPSVRTSSACAGAAFACSVLLPICSAAAGACNGSTGPEDASPQTICFLGEPVAPHVQVGRPARARCAAICCSPLLHVRQQGLSQVRLPSEFCQPSVSGARPSRCAWRCTWTPPWHARPCLAPLILP